MGQRSKIKDHGSRDRTAQIPYGRRTIKFEARPRPCLSGPTKASRISRYGMRAVISVSRISLEWRENSRALAGRRRTRRGFRISCFVRSIGRIFGCVWRIDRIFDRVRPNMMLIRPHRPGIASAAQSVRVRHRFNLGVGVKIGRIGTGNSARGDGWKR